MTNTVNKEKKIKIIKKDTDVINCGLIMPIAPMSSYSKEQFIDVKSILVETISDLKDYKFNVRMVSDSKGEVEIIHKNIVNNLYDDPIVICDVSGSNPNVLFELGMRLAFDKPTIIIKDDITKYMFDTSMIEHLEYPSDLRYNKLLDFKKLLQIKFVKTYEASLIDSEYSPFLKHFQNIEVKNIKSSSIDVTDALGTILEDIKQIKSNQSNYSNPAINVISKKNNTLNRVRSALKSEIISWILSDYSNNSNMHFGEALTKGKLPEDFFTYSKQLNFDVNDIEEVFNEAQREALAR